MKRSPNSINWDKLKIEFMASEETLRQFRIRHDLANNWFYKKAEGWEDERKALRERGVQRAMRVMENQYEKFATDTKKLLEVANHQVLAIYKKSMDPSGRRIVKPLRPYDLLNVVNVISTALKTFRLIEGKSTENVDARHTREYWIAMMDFVGGQIDTMPPEFQQQLLGHHGTDTNQPEQ